MEIGLSYPFRNVQDFDLESKIDAENLRYTQSSYGKNILSEFILQKFIKGRQGKIFPFLYGRNDYLDKEPIAKILDTHNSLRPCSAKIEHEKELKQLVSAIFQLADANYALSLEHLEDEEFPKDCCFISSVNILLSGAAHGLINGYIAGDHKLDHTIIVYPFTFNDLKGTITIDPTSDQYKGAFSKHRNYITISFNPDIAKEVYPRKLFKNIIVPKHFSADEVINLGSIKKHMENGWLLSIDHLSHKKKHTLDHNRYLDIAYRNQIRLYIHEGK